MERPNKQEYFKTNWLNTFSNQTLIPAGVTTTTRTTDEKGTYLEDDGVSHGNFIYATNIEWKGTNWICGLYNDPTRPNLDSKWMLFHIDTEGNFMITSGHGSGYTGDTPPTDEQWRKQIQNFFTAPYITGIIQNFDYQK